MLTSDTQCKAAHALSFVLIEFSFRLVNDMTPSKTNTACYTCNSALTVDGIRPRYAAFGPETGPLSTGPSRAHLPC